MGASTVQFAPQHRGYEAVDAGCASRQGGGGALAAGQLPAVEQPDMASNDACVAG